MFYVVSVYMLPTFNEHFFILNDFMDILILIPENIYIWSVFVRTLIYIYRISAQNNTYNTISIISIKSTVIRTNTKQIKNIISFSIKYADYIILVYYNIVSFLKIWVNS